MRTGTASVRSMCKISLHMATALALKDPVAEVAGQPGGGYRLLALVSVAGWSFVLTGTGTGQLRLTATRDGRKVEVEGPSVDELAPEVFRQCFHGGAA